MAVPSAAATSWMTLPADAAAQHDVDGKAVLAVLLEQGELLGPD